MISEGTPSRPPNDTLFTFYGFIACKDCLRGSIRGVERISSASDSYLLLSTAGIFCSFDTLNGFLLTLPTFDVDLGLTPSILADLSVGRSVIPYSCN